MKRILLITTSYPTGVPGSEAAGGFVADFAEALSHHADVTVVAPAEQAKTTYQGRVKVFTFQAPRLPLSLLKPWNPGDWLTIATTLRAGQNTTLRALRDDGCDHILALWTLPSGYWAKTAALRLGVAYSTWALGSDIWSLGRIPLIRSVLRNVLRNAQLRFADGYQLLHDVEQIASMPCHFLPSTRVLQLSGSKSSQASDRTRLAYLGRWHKNKGIDILLAALETMGDSDWTKISSIRIYGGGPLRSSVLQSTNKLISEGRPLHVGGYLNKENAAKLIQWADYLLIPSRIESIPVIFSDALQARTAMVVTPVGDFPEIFSHDAPGIMARDPSPTSFLSAVRLALERDPKEFIDSIHEKQKSFDVDRSVEKFLALVNNS